MAKKILYGLLLVFILIQAIRPARNRANAFTVQDIAHTVAVPDTVQRLLQAACYDCHSNHTDYPWYTNINPVGNWLAHHVAEGKAELNFSEFKTYSRKKAMHKMDEVVEQLQEKEMPLGTYAAMHSRAKLSDAQTQALIAWATAAKAAIESEPE